MLVLNRSLRVLGLVLVNCSFALGSPASAQDATWAGAGAEWTTGANWSSSAVPTDIATFAGANPTAVTISNTTSINEIQFNAGAPAYSFSVGASATFNVNGAGIVNNSSFAPSIGVVGNATLNFNAGTAGNAALTNDNFIFFLNGSSAGTATFANHNDGISDFFNTSTAAGATIANAGLLFFTDTSNAGNAVITNTGTLTFNVAASAGNAAVNNSHIMTFNAGSTAGNAAVTNSNVINFNATSTAGSASFSNSFDIEFNGQSTGGSAAFTNTTAGGTVDFSQSNGPNSDNKLSAGSFAGTGVFFLGANQVSVGSNNLSTTVNGVISDCGTGGNPCTMTGAAGGSLVKLGTGTLTLAGANTYTGGTTVSGGTLQLSGAGTLGATTGALAVSGGALDLGTTSQTTAALTLTGGTIQNGILTSTAYNLQAGTVSAVLAGPGNLTKTSPGLVTLSGINTYSGATAVSGGTLQVDGAIANTSGVTVNAGGILSGTGSVTSATTTIMSGGTLAPGNALNPTGALAVSGNLAFQSGAIYLVQVTPTTAASANVSGTATLGGATANAAFANGSYISRQYTILTAAGGVSGTFAPTVINSNMPARFTDALSYDATHAYLNLTLSFVPPPTPTPSPGIGNGLSRNQQAVGNALINFFNTTGGIPMVYGTLTAAGLTQASGELAAGSQQTTFGAMGLFMGLLTDPFMNRAGGANVAPGASGYADEASGYAAGKKLDAFAMFTKAPPAPFEQRWNVWAAGFGGAQTTNGNAATGSNNTTSNIYGTAVGADYLFSPNTIAGFALAGGGTNFGVNGAGSGRSDLFQAGAYLRHTEGAAYISAALAYGWQDITTNRTVSVAGLDQLRAEFNANAYSGRLEGGYRLVAPWTGGIGITPYAAAQFTTFDLPAYAESVIAGAPNFALAYATKNVTDTRSELGLRTDKSYVVQDAVLTLRSRFAWAHDYDPDRSIAATFQALPGASFVVNGAAQAADSALTTASVEMKWRNGWSAAATFEGEFSAVTASYAGKGALRYQW